MEMMQYNRGTGSLKNWLVEESAFDSRYLGKCEAIFTQGNGYIGQRAALEERYVGETRGLFVTGTFNKFDGNEVTELPNLPDLTWMDIWVDDTRFSLSECETSDYSRVLNLKNGELTRKVTLHTRDGKNVRFTFKRFVSLADDHLIGARMEIQSDAEFALKVVSGVDGTVSNHGSQHLSEGDKRVYGGKILEYPCKTEQSGVSIILHTALSADGAEYKTRSMNDRRKLLTELTAKVSAGKKFTLDKLSSVHSTRDLGYDGVETAEAEARLQPESLAAFEKVLEKTYDEHFAESEKAWDALWADQDIAIDSENDFDQLAIRYALYHLNIMVKKNDSRVGIGAKAMSGEGYKGHYFWDTEMYELPFFALTNREQAKNLISYRYQILPKAREHAKIYGHKKGALFAWHTITGEECSGYYPSGSAQYHLNGDIAFAVVNYYLLSGDLDFMAEKGAEILFETARLWMDLGCWANGSFHLNCVTGPDEYTCCVNDNYYTNAGAKYNLYWAAKMWELLGNAGKLDALAQRLKLTEDEIQEFKKAEAGMTLLYDEKTGINPQDDAFLQKPVWDFAGTPAENHPLLLHYHPLCLNRFQVCKQADTVLAHFVHEDYQSEETMRRSYDWYEKITTHDSSLSACIFGIMAARLGDMEKSVRYFSESSMLDITNAHHNTGDGIHTANMGGTYMGVVYGFAGLRVKEDGLIFRPQLPKGWKGYRFRFLYQDSLLELVVDGDGAKLNLISGSPKTVQIWNKTVTAK